MVPSRSTSTNTGVERADFVEPKSTCHAMLASSPAISDNFVAEVSVLSWRTTAKSPRGVHRSVAPVVVSKFDEKLPIIEP